MMPRRRTARRGVATKRHPRARNRTPVVQLAAGAGAGPGAPLQFAVHPGSPQNLQPVTSALAANTPDSSQQSAFEQELAALMVQALNLELQASEIDPTAQLYGDGLGLDSIDILELALEVSQRYGMDLRSDDENNVRIFQSLRSLAAHISANRTK
jgi:acyl carrier protein